MSTRTTSRGRTASGARGRSAAGTGAGARFGRSGGGGASSGRFGRTQAQSAGRFGRTMSLQQASGRRSSGSSSRGLSIMQRRSQPKKSGLAGALTALTSALPTGGMSSAAKRGGGKTPAGLALAAAAAGMAFKNRGKLAGMMGRGDKQQQRSEPMMPMQPQATPPAI